MRTPLPSASDLSYFLEVALTLNLSRAAERLGLSQPTLSLAIQRLEDAVGTPLLIRTKSGVRLSHAGNRLVSRAKSLLQEWEKIRAETLRAEEEIEGIYTIGCHPSVALFTLPRLLPKLLENSRLEIRLLHDLSRKITEDVISFKVDFGIVVNPTPHPDLIIRPLWKDEVTLWTAKQRSPLQDTKGGQAVIIYDPNLLQSQSLMKQLAKDGIPFARTITSTSLETIAELVAEGAGIGILPTRVAKQIAADRLKPLPQAPSFTDNHCLVYRADAQTSEANRKLARMMVAILV